MPVFYHGAACSSKRASVFAIRTRKYLRPAETDRREKLTGKAAKPPAAGGGGDKKLTADEWLAEELKKGK